MLKRSLTPVLLTGSWGTTSSIIGCHSFELSKMTPKLCSPRTPKTSHFNIFGSTWDLRNTEKLLQYICTHLCKLNFWDIIIPSWERFYLGHELNMLLLHLATIKECAQCSLHCSRYWEYRGCTHLLYFGGPCNMLWTALLYLGTLYVKKYNSQMRNLKLTFLATDLDLELIYVV